MDLHSWLQKKAIGRCSASSGELHKVLVGAWRPLGQVGNTDHENVTIGKAGHQSLEGYSPGKRGVSMNPVDARMVVVRVRLLADVIQ